MELTSVSGKVSYFDRVSSVHGGQGESAVKTAHAASFRLDGRHVDLQGSASWVSDGDHVAIVGEVEQGRLEPLAVRNDTTGYERSEPPASYALSIVTIVAGVLTLGFMVGFLLIPFGIWLLLGARKRRRRVAEAVALLQAIPRSPSPTPSQPLG